MFPIKVVLVKNDDNEQLYSSRVTRVDYVILSLFKILENCTNDPSDGLSLRSSVYGIWSMNGWVSFRGGSSYVFFPTARRTNLRYRTAIRHMDRRNGTQGG